MQKDWLIATNYMKTFITLSLKLIITSIIKTVTYEKIRSRRKRYPRVDLKSIGFICNSDIG